MMYVRFPLSLRNVEDLLHERGVDVSHETVRFWWNRFGPIIERIDLGSARSSMGVIISLTAPFGCRSGLLHAHQGQSVHSISSP